MNQKPGNDVERSDRVVRVHTTSHVECSLDQMKTTPLRGWRNLPLRYNGVRIYIESGARDLALCDCPATWRLDLQGAKASPHKEGGNDGAHDTEQPKSLHSPSFGEGFSCGTRRGPNALSPERRQQHESTRRVR